jgi:hypothetical protein
MLDHFIYDLFGYFDLVDCIFLCVYVCCLRRRSTLVWRALGGGAVSATVLALQFGASGGGRADAARYNVNPRTVNAIYSAKTLLVDALSPPHKPNTAGSSLLIYVYFYLNAWSEINIY